MSIFNIDGMLGSDGLSNDNSSDNAYKGDGQDNDNENEASTKTVEPKKRSVTVRNPQIRLNVEKLMEPRGIQAIQKYYSNIHFAGKGSEKQDVNNIMKRLEHWAHRLYPKYNFEDFLNKTEALGKKKQLQTYMTRYRQDMLDPPQINTEDILMNEQINQNNKIETAESIDDFDILISQQIEKYKHTPLSTINSIHKQRTNNSLMFDNISMISPKENQSILAQQQVPFPSSSINIIENQPIASSTQCKKLTPEQYAKMAENRLLAQEKLRAKRDALLNNNNN